MHREILKDKLSDGLEVDHENHNGLDNQRRNIRAVTHQKNILNSQPRRGSTSSYLGVSLDQNGRWRAFIRGKHLGRFNSEEDAKDVVERFLRGDEQPVRIGLAKDLVACQYCGDERLVLEPKAVKKTCRDCMCACWLEADNTLFDPNKPVSAFFEAQEKGEEALRQYAEEKAQGEALRRAARDLEAATGYPYAAEAIAKVIRVFDQDKSEELIRRYAVQFEHIFTPYTGPDEPLGWEPDEQD